MDVWGTETKAPRWEQVWVGERGLGGPGVQVLGV